MMQPYLGQSILFWLDHLKKGKLEKMQKKQFKLSGEGQEYLLYEKKLNLLGLFEGHVYYCTTFSSIMELVG